MHLCDRSQSGDFFSRSARLSQFITLSCSTLDSSNLLTLRIKAELIFFSLIADSDLETYQRHITYMGMSTELSQTVHVI